MKIKLFVFLSFVFFAVAAKAQFTVVDAVSGDTLPGVYVYAENGNLLAISTSKGEVKALNGKVTLSMLSYEPLTIDATGRQGQVALQPKAFDMAEVVVGQTEFVKLSAAFRDVVTNYGNVVLYREGLVDYYLNVKSKKWTRRIRACRQYEHQNLRKPWEDSVACWNLRLLDMGKVQMVKQSGSSTAHGDTTFVGAMKGKTEVKDGVMIIRKPGYYRSLIDQMKLANRTSSSALGMHLNLKKRFIDWTYSQAQPSDEDLKALRVYTEEDFQWGKKTPVVPVATTSDVAVYEVTYPSASSAKAEMKNKSITDNFTLPDCLPAIHPAAVEQGKKLVPKKFHDF